MASETVTTLLEMHERPQLAFTRPARSGMLLRMDEPAIGFYRFLQDGAGTRRSRTAVEEMSDPDLFARLSDDTRDVFVLFLGGAPAGFFELDRSNPTEVELVQVGLMPGFEGRGLGKYLVAVAVDAAWFDEPGRIWTSASSDEDPRGLLLYQWAGFTPFEAR